MEATTTNLPQEDASASFPVTFFEGEQELDKGPILITPSLTFKSFQSILSRLLQISPHQITIYFERPSTTSTHRSNHRSRYPVTSKFDFKSAMYESGSAFFRVVQKRSRRTRRRKPKNFISYPGDGNGNGNFILLRRDSYNNNYTNTINSNAIYSNEVEYYEYLKRVAMVEREREYLMSMSLNSNVYDDLGIYYNNSNNGYTGGGGGYGSNFSDDAASSSSSSAFCDVCFSFNAAFRVEDGTVPFHSCKNDVVTKVFRSPAGPIAPPPQKTHSFLG